MLLIVDLYFHQTVRVILTQIIPFSKKFLELEEESDSWVAQEGHLVLELGLQRRPLKQMYNIFEAKSLVNAQRLAEAVFLA